MVHLERKDEVVVIYKLKDFIFCWENGKSTGKTQGIWY